MPLFEHRPITFLSHHIPSATSAASESPSFNSAIKNLLFCLGHHEEYDSRTSQSKGIGIDEVRAYRDRLYSDNEPDGRWQVESENHIPEMPELTYEIDSVFRVVRNRFQQKLDYTKKPWRFPLWQIPDEPEFFAYKAGNGADGVCLVERIDIPDGRVVIACIETAGNPGQSITNCVGELCFQVCERFEIPPDNLVWLEHYDYVGEGEWRMVSFGQRPPTGPFADPKWIEMTPALWQDLRLRPRKKLRSVYRDYHSELVKLFPWPKGEE